MLLPRSTIRPRWLPVVLALVAVLAIAVPVLVALFPPTMPAPRSAIRLSQRVVPAAELPAVEPVAFQDLVPADARAFNATVPFSTDPNPAARPFRIAGPTEDQDRAVDCLAAAMLYEAGDDPAGERAVGQVIINRTRHPAFPKSICAVVFQGSERTTGCQFTFTCDGAMTRPPNPAAWLRAQALARGALTGNVFAAVGHATHYHTDWVVPYWSASLDKVAEVHTHLFFRWTGWWGTPPAFRRAVSDDEPVIPALAYLSLAHRTGDAIAAAALVAGANPVGNAGGVAQAADPNTFLVTLDKQLAADLLPVFAERICGDRAYCKVMGWTDDKLTPDTVPLGPAQITTMAFSYLRDRSREFEKPLWNCTVFKRTDPQQCMKVQLLLLRPAAKPTPSPTKPVTAPSAVPPADPASHGTAPAAAPAPATPRTLPPATP